MHRPRTVGLALLALTALPATIFISSKVPLLIPEAVILSLAASLVLVYRGFRHKPSRLGFGLLVATNLIAGQLLLLWTIRYIRLPSGSIESIATALGIY